MKIDSNFEQHPVQTKLGWFHTPGNNFYYSLNGGGPFTIQLNFQWGDGEADNSHLAHPTPNSGFIEGTQFFSPGVWIKVELIYKPSTTNTSRDGYYCSWIDDRLSACTNELNTPSNPHLQTSGTSTTSIWGGTGSVKTRDSFIWYDNFRIAVGETLPPTPPTDTISPNRPTGVSVQ